MGGIGREVEEVELNTLHSTLERDNLDKALVLESE